MRISEVADPTTYQWLVAATAVVLVVGVATALFVRLVRRGLTRAASWPRRVAGAAVAALGIATLLGVVVLVAAGVRAAGLGAPPAFGEPPLVTEPFAARIIDADPDITEDVARYATALLAPMGLLLGAVAVAVLRLGTTAARAAAAAACAPCVVAAGVAVFRDVGSLLSTLGWAVGLLAGLAIAALLVDEVTDYSSRSEASTSRSQRSLQSAQR